MAARFWLMPVLALVSTQLASAAQAQTFARYPAQQVFTGKPAKARIVNPQQRYWAKWIVSGKPNFAGHYRVVEWPCGTECMGLAVIDAKTGTVHAPPLNSDRWLFALPISSTDFRYPEYRLDSTLFIIRNACPEGLHKPCWTYYFNWRNDVFNVIAKVPVKVPRQVPIDVRKLPHPQLDLARPVRRSGS